MGKESSERERISVVASANDLRLNYGINQTSQDDSKLAARVSAVNLQTIQSVCLCILVVELCERLAFYTFSGTQESYLEKNGYSLSQAGGINSAMSTLCMAWAIVAGWAADCCVGRYHTIVIAGLIYAVGATLATLAASRSVASSWLYMFGMMFLLPIGTAGIKANISNFGADQFDPRQEEQAEAQAKFFSWFYLSINVGSAVAYGFLTTLATNGGLGIPKEDGYFAAYFFAAACMLIAVMVFMQNKQRYKVSRVSENSALGDISRYVLASAKLGSMSAINLVMGVSLLAATITISVTSALTPVGNKQLAAVASICAICGVVAVIFPCMDPSWLVAADLPGASITRTDALQFIRLLPVLFTANLCFSPLYNSMQFWYQQQACQMNLHVPFTKGSQFSGSFFMIADCLAIVLATPVAINIVDPWLRTKLHLSPISEHKWKFTLGVILGFTSVFMAAELEILRRSAPVMSETSNCAANGVAMSSMAAAWILLPFFLMGLGEIYTQPVIMHFAYSRSPESTRTLAAVTGLVIAAVSNAVFTIQVNALSSFVPDDLNKGNLEYGYYSNLILALLFYAAYRYALHHTTVDGQ